MQYTKRLLSILLTLCFLPGLLPAAALPNRSYGGAWPLKG